MFGGFFFVIKLLKESLAKASTRECMTRRSGREYRSFSSINSMATPSMDDFICLMATEAEARREGTNQHRLDMATEAEARREEANQHRLEIAEMEQ